MALSVDCRLGLGTVLALMCFYSSMAECNMMEKTAYCIAALTVSAAIYY